MKDLKTLPRIECFVNGEWKPVQDARQLEPGDIIRMWEGATPVSFGGKRMAVVMTPAAIKNRMLTPKEYEHVLHPTVVTPEPSTNPVTQA